MGRLRWIRWRWRMWWRWHGRLAAPPPAQCSSCLARHIFLRIDTAQLAVCRFLVAIAVFRMWRRARLGTANQETGPASETAKAQGHCGVPVSRAATLVSGGGRFLVFSRWASHSKRQWPRCYTAPMACVEASSRAVRLLATDRLLLLIAVHPS
jgi:hypothetical protein